MKVKKLKPIFRGIAATSAALLTLSAVGYGIAKSELAIGWVDGYFNVDRTIYNDWVEDVPGYTIPGSLEGYSYLKGKQYTKRQNTVVEYAEQLKAHAVKQGEEGFALLKNDNGALPLNKSSAGSNVALFGWNAYNMPSGHTGVVAGNFIGTKTTTGWNGKPQTVTKNAYYDNVTLCSAFDTMQNITVNNTLKGEHFTGAMVGPSRGGGFGGGASTPWGEYEYAIPEAVPEDDVVNSWNIDKSTTTAIVALGRGGGEGNNYKVDAATNAEDPLALSEAELKLVQLAKEKCAKVVVLIVSANAMELGPLVEEGGQYEVDAIGFCGIPNDYQYEGIANVLAGKVNATGGLTDTYVYDNSYTPASINMGEQQYSDLNTISAGGDLLGRTGNISYLANNYIVEAEGVYVGYKYYETRYYDSIVNASYNAKSAVGSSTGKAWDYSDEVVFTFGQSLSYIPYTQEILDVKVDLSENGKTTASVRVTNNGTEDGYFLAQLYVNRPYTQYDIDNKIEKSAVDFLNSKKVSVKAGESETIQITVPTRYLASWDSSALNGAGTYVLDQGDYLFTAAAGAHAAVNNILAEQGHKTDGTTTINRVAVWDELKSFDDKTFSVSNGVEVRNQMENADINYFLGEDTVTYLSRSDWEGTFPKNYTNYTNDSGIAPENKFTIEGAEKQAEWIRELQNAQYKVTPTEDSSKWVNVEGVKPAGLAEGQTVWQWIMSVAQSNPKAFSDINSDEWQAVAAALNLGTAISSIGESGGSSRTFEEIGNPISKQSESVAGYQQTLIIVPDEDKDKQRTFALNIASNTLLGSSFNPDLAYEWGVLEGEGGLWLQEQGIGSGNAVTVWGAGLNQHRHAYNGRNSEYMSEDPMLTNRIGEAQLRGAVSKGSICGPKHMGFNDQELNRQGVACYMTEQKVRETDTRCYEGALRVDEGNGTGVMMSFARIGATNVTNSVGYIKNIMRGEWGFTGIISTDMGQANYHEVGAMVMATCNEYAGFGSGTIYTNVTEDTGTFAKASYITLGNARKDPAFAAQARQTALYLLYTIAHSGSGIYVERVENTGEDIVVPPYQITHHDPVGILEVAGWENIFIALEAVFGICTALAGLAWVASIVLPEKKGEN